MQKRFSHIARYVSDLQKSLVFYESILLPERIPDPFKDDHHAWLSMGDGLQLHLIGGMDISGNKHRRNHICFAVQDLDRFMDFLVQKQVVFVDSKNQPGSFSVRGDGIRQIYFQDPDGYWIEANDEPVENEK